MVTLLPANNCGATRLCPSSLTFLPALSAWRLAKELLGRVAKGDNPAEERAIHRGASTVKDICKRFMEEYVPLHCKESTGKEYQRSVDLFINPSIGTRKASPPVMPTAS